jgi:hypothetical protein
MHRTNRAFPQFCQIQFQKKKQLQHVVHTLYRCSAMRQRLTFQFNSVKSMNSDAAAAVVRIEGAKTLYDVLGLPSSATSDEVVSAYRAACLVLHPDKSGGDTTAAFQLVRSAYDVVGDAPRRAEYDAVMACDVQRIREDRLALIFAALTSAAAPSAGAPQAAQHELRCLRCGAPRLASNVSLCPACAGTTSAKAGLCSKFGCLNPLPAGAASTERCTQCNTRPVKCKTFGCLRKATPPATLCPVHTP